MNNHSKYKTPFGSLRARNSRMKRTTRKKTSPHSNREENYNMENRISDMYRRRARKAGFNPAVANAALARDKYIEWCEEKGIKPDPKELEQLQKGVNNEINMLSRKRFNTGTMKRRF